MQSAATGNRILNLIAESDGGALFPILAKSERIRFEPGTRLQTAGEPIAFAYFPISGVLSLAWILDDGLEVNTLGIGHDGAIHAGPDIDLERASHHVIPQLAGWAWQVPAPLWQELLNGNPAIKSLLGSYTEFVLARSQQALACQMKHDVESRLCHWLLDMHEWQAGQPLTITHQGLSRLLGVRRTTITLMARALQDAGIISYRRGVIEISDLYALQQASCTCHRIRHSWPPARLLPRERAVLDAPAADGTAPAETVSDQRDRISRAG